MKTVAIIQARMGSSRFPGKVLAEVAGEPMLAHVVRRAAGAAMIGEVVVATSNAPADDQIARFCEERRVSCFRGSEDDVLDRYLHAARMANADVVVRLTADCPLLDPDVIDTVVRAFLEGGADYAANVLIPTFPDGLDTEVFSCSALERAAAEARLPPEREHVTLFIRNHPEWFRLRNVIREAEDLSSLRWTVDEPRDLELVRQIYAMLGLWDFGMAEILDLLEKRPDIFDVNSGIERNEGLRRSLERDASITQMDTVAWHQSTQRHRTP